MVKQCKREKLEMYLVNCLEAVLGKRKLVVGRNHAQKLLLYNRGSKVSVNKKIPIKNFF